MKRSLLVAVLAPTAVLAATQQAPAVAHAHDLQRDLDLDLSLTPSSPAASIPEYASRVREPLVQMADPEPPASKLGARQLGQARSEGTLGQTPWIGMAIGLTFTALAAMTLG